MRFVAFDTSTHSLPVSAIKSGGRWYTGFDSF